MLDKGLRDMLRKDNKEITQILNLWRKPNGLKKTDTLL